MRRFMLTAALLLATAATVPLRGLPRVAAPAHAQSGGDFGVRPEDPTAGYFQYTLGPGERVEDAILVQNNNAEHSIRLVVHPVLAVTGLTGSIGFDAPDPADLALHPYTPVGVAAWIDLPGAGEVEIPADKAMRMPFTLTVPAGAAPGEYVAGFVAAPAASPETQSAGAFGVRVIPQVAVTVVITVPAPGGAPLQPKIAISAVTLQTEGASPQVVISMANAGNAHFVGAGTLALKSPDGVPVLSQEFPVGYFIPGDHMNYPVYLSAVPAAGQYLAEVALADKEGAPAARYMQTLSVSAAAAEAVQAAAAAAAPGASTAAESGTANVAIPAWLATWGPPAIGILALAISGLMLARARKAPTPGACTWSSNSTPTARTNENATRGGDAMPASMKQDRI